MSNKRFDHSPRFIVKDDPIVIQQATGSSVSLLELKDPSGNTLVSVSSSGTLSAPTPTAGTNSTEIATTAFVGSALTALIPSGIVVPFAGGSAPTGWFLCFGQELAIATYASLYAAVGTTYGSLTNGSGGAGSTHFRLPDLRGRVIAGMDMMGGTSANRLTNQSGGLDGDQLGATGGFETHTLTESQIPSHNHTQNAHNHTQNAHNHGPGNETHFVTVSSQTVGGIAGSGVYQAPYNKAATTANQTATNNAETATNNATGGSGAHNNVQPTIILNYIIKA